MFKKTLIVILLLSASYLTGCASAPTTSVDKDTTGKEAAAGATSAQPAHSFGDHKAQGFLTDYSKISKTQDDYGSYRYVDSTADFSKYNKLLVDRIKIFFMEDSEYKGIDPDELKALTDYFYEAINKAMGDTYPMVTEVGPDVLRLRVAITDLVPNNVAASVTTLLVPFLWVADAGTGVATGDAGGTVFTGQATYAHGIATGVKGYIHSYSKWAYTKKAMDDWAQLLRKRIDEVHGIKAKE